MIPLAIIWLSFVLPLIVAAVGGHRPSTKIGALACLAVVFMLSWAAIVLAPDDLPAHTDADFWQSAAKFAGGFLLAYLLVVFAAVRRKLL